MPQTRTLIAIAATALVATASLSTLKAQTAARKSATPDEPVTLIGTLVDLQCEMTDTHRGNDKTKCVRECIKRGVPVGLLTEQGLVIVGMGYEGARKLSRFAMQPVRVTGTLYEKHGVLYIDAVEAKAAKTAASKPGKAGKPGKKKAKPEKQPEGDEEWDDPEGT